MSNIIDLTKPPSAPASPYQFRQTAGQPKRDPNDFPPCPHCHQGLEFITVEETKHRQIIGKTWTDIKATTDSLSDEEGGIIADELVDDEDIVPGSEVEGMAIEYRCLNCGENIHLRDIYQDAVQAFLDDEGGADADDESR